MCLLGLKKKKIEHSVGSVLFVSCVFEMCWGQDLALRCLNMSAQWPGRQSAPLVLKGLNPCLHLLLNWFVVNHLWTLICDIFSCTCLRYQYGSYEQLKQGQFLGKLALLSMAFRHNMWLGKHSVDFTCIVDCML